MKLASVVSPGNVAGPVLNCGNYPRVDLRTNRLEVLLAMEMLKALC